MTPNEKREIPIFVGGAGRSGTTLLRLMLDSHPAIFCGPELKITLPLARAWAEAVGVFGARTFKNYGYPPEEITRRLRDILIDVLDSGARAQGKPRAAEKTPVNLSVFLELAEMFPASPLIHVLRDGRDVVSSLLQVNWTIAGTNSRPDYTRNAHAAALYWARAVAMHERITASPARKNYCVVRYEALVREPEKTLRALCAFMGEAFDPRMLKFNEIEHVIEHEKGRKQARSSLSGASIGRWRQDLTLAQQKEVKAAIGPLLARLGYDREEDW